MSAGHKLACLLVLALAGGALAGCAATPQDRTGEVISIDPKICVNATTGADYCFEQNTVERKVPGIEVGDCVDFAHTQPKKPGGLFHLERMSRCGEADQDQDGAGTDEGVQPEADQGAADGQEDAGNQ